jgi:uncharacterized protein YkwD
MLRTALLTMACLTAGLPIRAADRPADALLPTNGSVDTVSAAKVITEEKPGPHDWLVKNQNIVRLVTQTNQHRAQMGLGPVILDAQMCLDAQRHASWMAATGAFQHSSLPYMEIIFQGVGTPEAAVQGWIASPPHHGIMLSGSRVGFGYKLRGGYPYWVGVFR